MNTAIRWSLTFVAVVGLAIDAYTHFDLAPQFVFNRTSTISEGTLFRIEGALAIAVAVLLVVWSRWWTTLVALAVAGGGLALLLIYRYVDVGQIGPIPNMYEPIWFAEKEWSVIGEAIAVVALLGLLGFQLWGRSQRDSTASHQVATLAG
jgi:hypothetical protein